MLADFFEKGWAVFDEPLLEERDDIIEYLGNKYLNVFPSWELVEWGRTEWVEHLDTTEWHNDGNWGMNLTILYYADTMSPEVGGSISIRNGTEEERIYPKAGTLVVMSQKPHMDHRAEVSTVRRRMYNIDFNVGGY